jgi:hypothetical protein
MNSHTTKVTFMTLVTTCNLSSVVIARAPVCLPLCETSLPRQSGNGPRHLHEEREFLTHEAQEQITYFRLLSE